MNSVLQDWVMERRNAVEAATRAMVREGRTR